MKKNLTTNRKPKGQVIIEFMFSVIITFLLIYGLIMVFRWTGVGLAERRIAHENVLLGDTPVRDQIDPHFLGAVEIDAVMRPNN